MQFADQRLMIVDDHPEIRRLIREITALPAGSVCECASGEAAIQLALHFRPNLVTMDLRLPGMSGFDAAYTLHSLLPEVRIWIVSAYDQPELRQAATMAGANGYLVKDDLTLLPELLLAL